MPTLNFMPRMVDPILGGTKVHTVRFGKRAYRPGQNLQMQTGSRYKPTRFITLPCTRVRGIRLSSVCVSIWSDVDLSFIVPARNLFARCDGFEDWEDLLHWLDLKPGERRDGRLIQWAPAIWESSGEHRP